MQLEQPLEHFVLRRRITKTDPSTANMKAPRRVVHVLHTLRPVPLIKILLVESLHIVIRAVLDFLKDSDVNLAAGLLAAFS